MTIWIWTGGRPSNSAKELTKAPGFRRMVIGKALKAKDVIVNWGTSKAFPTVDIHNLNRVAAVAQASNKFFTFGTLAGKKISTVPWTANKAVAQEWQNAGSTIVVRNILTGHSGHGIVIIEEGQAIPDAPLYTKYIFKEREYRVHATCAKVIDTQRKIKDPQIAEPKSWKVRSHENGFIFVRGNIMASDNRDSLAMSTIKALDLDFGAVDIIEDKKGIFYVLEVNTAPGLEGQTVTNYVNCLQELASDLTHA